jgi:hypothetical protein
MCGADLQGRIARPFFVAAGAVRSFATHALRRPTPVFRISATAESNKIRIFASEYDTIRSS